MCALVGTDDVDREVRVSSLVHLVRVIECKGDVALVPTHCPSVIESQDVGASALNDAQV